MIFSLKCMIRWRIELLETARNGRGGNDSDPPQSKCVRSATETHERAFVERKLCARESCAMEMVYGVLSRRQTQSQSQHNCPAYTHENHPEMCAQEIALMNLAFDARSQTHHMVDGQHYCRFEIHKNQASVTDPVTEF